MNRPVSVTIAAISVVVLLLVSAVWPLVGGDELLGLGNSAAPGGNIPPGPRVDLIQGAPPSLNGTAQDTSQPPLQPDKISQPGDSSAPDLAEASNGDMNQPDNPAGIQPDSNANPSDNGIMRNMRILQYALYVIVIVCGLIAFGGLWAWKPWGIVMAVITSLIVIVMSAVSFFGISSTLMLIESIVKVIIALVVIVLVLLPVSRVVKTEV